MSNYTKSTNFATKDNLTPGDPLKVVRGTEIDTEYNNIATAIATKTDNSAAAITGGSITGITDLAVADGGTGASTATAAINNLLPAQTSAANKYLQSDGTNVSWDAVTLSTSDITGTLAVANGGTGVTSSTGTGSVVLSNSPTLVTPALGTPASGVATNLTGLPISTGVSGLGTGVATFLGTPSSANLASAVSDETGSGALVFANSPTLVTPALGTPSALVGTNITGTASGLTAGNVTTNANLTGAVTSVGNATSLGSFSSANLLGALTDETGTGSAVFATSPTLVTPILGTPTSATLTNATGLPIATGVSGLGTGVATFLATPSSANLAAALTDETGTGSAVFATSPTLVTPILGTPTSATLTNATGLPLTTGVTGTLPTANGGTNLGGATPFTSGGVVYASSASALFTGSDLTFNGTTLVSPTYQATGNTAFKTNSSSGQYYHFDNASGNNFMGLAVANKITLYAGGAENINFTGTSLYTASGISVGIGTSSPVVKLQVGDTSDVGLALSNSSSVTSGNRGTIYAYNSNVSTVGYIRFGADTDNVGTNIQFGTRPVGGSVTGSMTLSSAGNLGLGVTPSAWTSNRLAYQNSSSAFWTVPSVPDLCFLSANYFDDGANKYIANGYASYYRQGSGAHSWHTAPNNTSGAGAAATLTQAMTLTASGELLVGTTSAFGVGCTITNNGEYYAQANGQRSLTLRRNDSDGEISAFSRGATQVGNISVTTTATAYNTSSDYRLKNITGPIATSGAYIDSLNPVEGTWKSDGSTFVGLIAHEVQEASRTNVATGTKDGAEMQAMDYSNSELIANLIAEVKSLRQRVATLEAQ